MREGIEFLPAMAFLIADTMMMQTHEQQDERIAEGVATQNVQELRAQWAKTQESTTPAHSARQDAGGAEA